MIVQYICISSVTLAYHFQHFETRAVSGTKSIFVP